MKAYLMTITAVILMSFGCETVQTEKIDNSNLVVKAGYICGWGSGQDSITITQKQIKYMYQVPRKSQQTQLTRTSTTAEWSEILNAVNTDDFAKLNYNTCNVCADGCDEWISITDGKFSHKITFSKGGKIDSISKLQIQLAKLRAEFNPQ